MIWQKKLSNKQCMNVLIHVLFQELFQFLRQLWPLKYLTIQIKPNKVSEIIQNFNNISKLETDEFNMKNELWSMKYDV